MKIKKIVKKLTIAKSHATIENRFSPGTYVLDTIVFKLFIISSIVDKY
jgi:IS30 family transposase